MTPSIPPAPTVPAPAMPSAPAMTGAPIAEQPPMALRLVVKDEAGNCHQHVTHQGRSCHLRTLKSSA
jgi:hypothetical protein